MNDRQTQTYRNFIDEMVAIARRCVPADRIGAHGHMERTNDRALPLTAEEALRKEFCLTLSPGQTAILAQSLLDEREAAIHDVLSYLE